MGFIGKLIPSIAIGGFGFWILTMMLENLYFQIIGSLAIAVVMYVVLSVIDKKKPRKSTVKKNEPQTNEEDKDEE